MVMYDLDELHGLLNFIDECLVDEVDVNRVRCFLLLRDVVRDVIDRSLNRRFADEIMCKNNKSVVVDDHVDFGDWFRFDF